MPRNRAIRRPAGGAGSTAREPVPRGNPEQTESGAREAGQIWAGVITAIRQDGGLQELLHFASQARPVEFDAGKLTVATPNAFVRDQILHQRPDTLLETARQSLPELDSIEVLVDSGMRPPSRATAPDRETAPPGFRQPAWPTDFFRAPATLPRLRFERFVASRPNAALVRAAVHFAEAATPRFPSIFVHGKMGTGKTHLRHAVARRHLERHPERRVLSVTANAFWTEYGRACRESLNQTFREYCARVDLLAIDDIQQLAGRMRTQEMLLAMLDHMLENGGRVVAFADRPLGALKALDPGIVARLSGGPNTRLEEPDVETRLAILRDHAACLVEPHARIVWHEDALRYIAERARPDGRDLEGCMQQILSEVEPLQLEVTRARAEKILQSRFLVLQRRFGVAEIRRHVARHFGVDEREMTSRRRAADIVRARQVAMYVARELTRNSLSAIGADFGGRDHSTVSYALQRVGDACARDVAFEAEVRELIRGLESA